jgi:GTP-binding protein
MKIQSATFVAAAFALDQLPKESLPQVAMIGSSNVGKSSLINQLGRNPKLAHVSSTPGKTASINFYRINDAFHLVDLPGYGYAKVSHTTRESWGPLISGYLTDNPLLMGGVLIIDIRHPPKPDDLEFHAWAQGAGLPMIVAANKADKLGKQEQQKQILRLADDLQRDPSQVMLLSAETGLGKDALLRAIHDQMLAEALKRPVKAAKKAAPATVPDDFDDEGMNVAY